MRKKRKVWWVVGRVLCFFALFFVTSHLISLNSPDAKLERVLKQIISEHGFVYVGSGEMLDALDYEPIYLETFYRGRALSEEDERQITQQLDEACPTYSVDVFTYNGDGMTVTLPSDEQSYEALYLTSESGSLIRLVGVVFDDNGLRGGGDVPSSYLTIHRQYNRSSWSFLKKLLAVVSDAWGGRG